MSIFDIPKPYLNPILWLPSGTQLRPEVTPYIIALLEQVFSMDKVHALVMIGSSVGYTYGPTSDIDINVMARKGATFEIWHKIFKDFNNRPNLYPGTQHPINFFFQEYVPDSDWSNSLGAYDMLQNKWLKRPIPFDKLRDPEERYINEIAYSKLILDGLDNDVAQIEGLKEEGNDDEAERRLKQLAIQFKTIEDNRKTSYKYHIGTPALQEYNVIYKIIERSRHANLFKKLIEIYDEQWKLDMEKQAINLRGLNHLTLENIEHLRNVQHAVNLTPELLGTVRRPNLTRVITEHKLSEQNIKTLQQGFSKKAAPFRPEIIYTTFKRKGLQTAAGLALSAKEAKKYTIQNLRDSLTKQFDVNLAGDKLYNIQNKGGIILNSSNADDFNKFVRAHELTHWLRGNKGKWTNKQYGWNPVARLVEEGAANTQALLSSVPKLRENILTRDVALGGGTLGSIMQEVLVHPIISAGALGTTGTALYTLKKTHEHNKTAGKIKDSANYGWYVSKHKANIVSPMLQMKLPLMQALKHDLSKLRPSEFGPYRDWFNGPKGINGTRDPKVHADWRKAVELHYTRNPHHWKKRGEEWQNVPLKVREESLADWYSVGKTIRKKGTEFPTFKNWFQMHEKGLPIDSVVKKDVESKLGLK